VSNSKVEKALLKGSVKQRINLLCNNTGDKALSGKGFLTEDEESALVSSFKTDKDRETYRVYRRYFETVRVDLSNLSQARLGYVIALDHLEKAILSRVANEDFEDAVNLALNMITDKKLKKETANIIKDRFSNVALNRFLELDKEGYIMVKHQEHLADEMIVGIRKKLDLNQVKIKTHIKALKDFLDEIGLKVRVFDGYIKSTENWLKSDKGKEGTWLLSRKAERKNFELENNIAEVEIDQRFYDHYKRELYGK
jgi:hypothetical protein